MSTRDATNGFIVGSIVGFAAIVHLSLQTSPNEQFAWGDIANHILKFDDNDNEIREQGAWLRELWDGTGLVEVVSGQIANETADTRCDIATTKKNGEFDGVASTSTPVERIEQNAQTSGANTTPSRIITPFPMDGDIIDSDANDVDCDEDH